MQRRTKNLFISFISFCIFILCSFSLSQEIPDPEIVTDPAEVKRAALLAEQQASKGVVVDVELERVDGVKTYEIQIQEGKTKKSFSLNQSEPLFSIPLRVGKYTMRSRMKTSQETSPWSDWIPLEAPPDQVKLLEIPDKYYISKKEKNAPILIDWGLANGAKTYRIWFEKINSQVQKEKDRKIKKIETISNSFTAKLPVGVYKIGVQSISPGGIASSVTYFERQISIEYALLPKIKITQKAEDEYSWEKFESAKVRYVLSYKPFFGEEFKTVKEEVVEFEQWKIPGELVPGEYRIQFQYVSDDIQNGETETIYFVRKPKQVHFDEASGKLKNNESNQADN